MLPISLRCFTALDTLSNFDKVEERKINEELDIDSVINNTKSLKHDNEQDKSSNSRASDKSKDTVTKSRASADSQKKKATMSSRKVLSYGTSSEESD
jgi:hypothetical protein